MEELSMFLVLCSTMFIGSYAAGFLPLAFTFSEVSFTFQFAFIYNSPRFQSKVRLLSILGAGLLVGTALSVILPEGIEALQPRPSHRKLNLIIFVTITIFNFQMLFIITTKTPTLLNRFWKTMQMEEMKRIRLELFPRMLKCTLSKGYIWYYI